ncbi:MAG: MutS-related protein, partial [Bryobacteraceae bacterium]
MSEAPRIEYSRRLKALRGNESRFEHRHRSLGIATLLAGVAALILGILALWSRSASIVWPVLAVIGIAVFAVLNERAIRGRQRCRRAIAFHERGLARLEDRWIGTGETGDRFLEESHPYSRDLDLFGRGSLFELLCTARTQAGEETLARWLLHAADPVEVHRRQEAISDLRDRLDLREGLAVLGEDVCLGVHPEALAAWGEGNPWLVPMPLR